MIGPHCSRAVDRIDDGEIRTVVFCFVEEMSVRHLGHGGVHHPHHDEVREEPLIGGATNVGDTQRESCPDVQVPDFRPIVRQRRTEHSKEAVSRRIRRTQVEMGSEILDDCLAPIALADGDELLGNLTQRLVPADLLPLSLTAFTGSLEGDRQATGAVHHLRVASALLTTPRIEIGHAGLRGFVVGRLFLTNDDSVLDVEVPVACTPAVQPTMRTLRDMVPAPSLAVEILPARKCRFRGRRRARRHRLRGQAIEVKQRQCGRGETTEMQEATTIQPGNNVLSEVDLCVALYVNGQSVLFFHLLYSCVSAIRVVVRASNMPPRSLAPGR